MPIIRARHSDNMFQRGRNSLYVWASAALSVCACHLEVFDYRLANADKDAGTARAAATRRATDAGAQDRFGALGNLAGSQASVEAQDAAGTHAAVAGSGAAGEPAAPEDAGQMTQTTQTTTVTAADSGSARPLGPPCPRFPTETDESFCYDFESGLNGPNNGETYDLWTTPELAIAGQLTAVEAPDEPGNHVLQTLPARSSSEASAALSHSTRPFEHATVELDLWANDALVSASSEVSWLRFVPIDGDYERVTALFFRRGEAFLRSEGDATEYPLPRPRTDGKPTHVKVLLDRSGPCRTTVELDGELAAATSGGDCASDYHGFVELGLIMSDRASGELSALYDNFAFSRN